ncbi:MAG: hypothetical protein QM775_33845 [Pirellulales bacterium]
MKVFADIMKVDGTGALHFPVYEGFGNHDGGIKSALYETVSKKEIFNARILLPFQKIVFIILLTWVMYTW